MKKQAVFVLVFLLALASSAEGKTLKFNKGNANVNQLHDELLGASPSWRGTEQPDGSFKDPLLRVEDSESEILITVPDEVADGVITQAVTSHVPQSTWPLEPPEPAGKKSAKNKLKALGFTDKEIDEILK